MAFSVHTWTGMQTTTKSSHLDAGTANLVKVGSAQQASAYMKVIAPLISTGPASPARVVHDSASMVIVRFPHIVFAGALVQIRIQNRILFGKARRCIATESEYEVEIEIQELY